MEQLLLFNLNAHLFYIDLEISILLTKSQLDNSLSFKLVEYFFFFFYVLCTDKQRNQVQMMPRVCFASIHTTKSEGSSPPCFLKGQIHSPGRPLITSLHEPFSAASVWGNHRMLQKKEHEKICHLLHQVPGIPSTKLRARKHYKECSQRCPSNIAQI